MRKSAIKSMDKPVEAASNGAYQALVGGIASVIDEARRAASRSATCIHQDRIGDRGLVAPMPCLCQRSP